MALHEFQLIERYFSQPPLAAVGVAPCAGVRWGIGDDCALLDPPRDASLAISIDTLVEGVHFLADADPFSIGWRALAVNLSDLAAVAASPSWFTLALVLPVVDEFWLDGFSRGLTACAVRYRSLLVGGNLAQGPRSITLQVAGEVPAALALSRRGARVGDGLYVTGTLGDAAAGLALLRGQLQADATDREFLSQRYLQPTPRIEAGLQLRGLASAMIDLSDGLAGDLHHLISGSGVGFTLELNDLPLSAALCRVADRATARRWAFGHGDDYELCFTAPRTHEARIEAALATVGVGCRRIGLATAAAGLTLTLDGQQQPADVALHGYRHFEAPQ